MTENSLFANNDEIKEIRDELIEHLKEDQKEHEQKQLKSQEYIQGIKYLHSITVDFINTLRLVSFYSTRADDIYKDFFTISVIDELIESSIAISYLSEQGIYNPLKRELRYLLELTVKSVGIDYNMMGKSLSQKIEYFQSKVPNSSIEYIETYRLPFNDMENDKFKSDIKDLFYKSSAYVHPSKKQFIERLNNKQKGNYIGFDTAEMLTKFNKLLFRTYDIIITLLFHGFGESMTGDLFIQILDDNKKWKYHKGKYVGKYSHLFDYKSERKRFC
jgi:hypothetical protein